MSDRQRPKYGGIPKAVENQLAVRRGLTEPEGAGAATVQQPAPAQPPIPVERRLSALEKKIDGLAHKLDLVLDVLTGTDAVDPQPKPKRTKAHP